jgi:hypothetical protein
MPAIYGQGLYGKDSYGQLGLVVVIAVGSDLELVTLPVTLQDVPLDLALDQTGNLIINAAGDLATVSGSARLMQDVWKLAVTPLGASLGDPAYGDAFAGMVGQPLPTLGQAQARAGGLAGAIKAVQAARTAAGMPPGYGEVIDHIDVDHVAVGGGSVEADLTVWTATGQPISGSVPLTQTR